jgi:hypothetical protein
MFLVFLTLFSAFLIGCCTSSEGFYPLGIYDPGTTNDFKEIHTAGFNLITGSPDEATLREARLNNLRVLVSIGPLMESPFSAAKAAATIRKLDPDPGLWAWYISDEPDFNAISPSRVKSANRWIKRLAKKPTALVVSQGAFAIDYLDVGIMMVDRYPIPWLPLANVAQNLQLARLAIGQKKQLIAVIQAFDWKYHREVIGSRASFRPPSYDELRCMVYSASVEGANGLLFFSYDDKKWRMTDHPQTWADVRMVVREVNQRLPLFSSRHLSTGLDRMQLTDESGLNEVWENAVRTVLVDVRHGNDTIQPGIYLIAVNTVARKLPLKIKISTSGFIVNVFEEGRVLPLLGGFLSDEIGGYGVHVYGPIPLRSAE